VRTYEGHKPLGRNRRRLKDNIKIDLTGIGCEGENWIQVTQADCCEYGNECSGSTKGWEFSTHLATISFPRNIWFNLV
jgi:hypothetical protein